MPTTEYTAVADLMAKARTLSTAARIQLAEELLSTVKPVPTPSSGPRSCPTAAEVMNQFRSLGPAPDDATLKQWIDEYRTEKYGK